ncbi:MAG: hypothetical protein NWF01_11120 [Candidatus Bathyarchaeota archaeon]|nr:hypothetical protein [Candidatus Bathyarchaeota archaeon]
MADLKEDIGLILSSAIAGVGAFLSWFYQSGLLGTVTGIVIGAGITYFVQTRTQKRLWKREYTIKITEQVYGELFGEIKIIINKLENDFNEQIILENKWAQIQNDHRYFMVDQKFREELDSFYASLSRYNTACWKLGSEAKRILEKSAKIIFDKKPDKTPQLTFSYVDSEGRENSTLLLIDSDLKHLTTLKQMEQQCLRNYGQDIVEKQFKVSFQIINGTRPFEVDDSDPRVSSYWELCLKLFKEDENFLIATKEKNYLVKQAPEIKKALEKRISEPWKI